jgi:hypothetical protein
MIEGTSDLYGLLEELTAGKTRSSGTGDDNDDRNDEHAGENEASVREHDENTEAPEEFSVDDEDALPDPEDGGDRGDE